MKCEPSRYGAVFRLSEYRDWFVTTQPVLHCAGQVGADQTLWKPNKVNSN